MPNSTCQHNFSYVFIKMLVVYRRGFTDQLVVVYTVQWHLVIFPVLRWSLPLRFLGREWRNCHWAWGCNMDRKAYFRADPFFEIQGLPNKNIRHTHTHKEKKQKKQQLYPRSFRFLRIGLLTEFRGFRLTFRSWILMLASCSAWACWIPATTAWEAERGQSKLVSIFLPKEGYT